MLIMKHFGTLVAFVVVVQANQVDYCSENVTFSDLPHSMLHQVISFVVTGKFRQAFGCQTISNTSKILIDLYLYNRENKTNAILLNSDNKHNIDTTKKTILLLHGWLCNGFNGKTPQLKDAYLERHDCNVIDVDWSRYSVDLYANSFCTLPKVATTLAEFLCGLEIDFGLIHLVGHSMGGQLSGLVGQEVQKQCGKKVGRITALDPAGPLYHGLTEDRRLDEKDAKFVDVIHTNAGIAGYKEPCGTVDFYPNCGDLQAGCMPSNKKLKIGPFKFTYNAVACSHIRSVELMIASIQGTKFYAKQCQNCTSISGGLSCYGEGILMGEDCPLNQTRGNYYLKTKSIHPFA